MLQYKFKFKFCCKLPFTFNVLFHPTFFSGYFTISEDKNLLSYSQMPLGCIIFWSAYNFLNGFFVGPLDQPLFQISPRANLFRVLNYISSSSCNDGVKPSQCLPTYNKSLTNQKTKGKIISTFFFELILSLQG